MLSITKVAGYPIWHIQSPHRHELALTFLRMQEFQESPNERFCGKVFTLDEYMDWYMQCGVEKNDAAAHSCELNQISTDEWALNAFARKRAGKNGAFTYAADWSGFNVKSLAVQAVHQQFAPHTIWEKALFGLLEDMRVLSETQFYLIGTQSGETSDFFEHELRHGLFGVCGEYRNEVLTVLEQFRVDAFRARLAVDYGEDVLDDEVHAYALTGYGNTYGKPETEEMRALTAALKMVEVKYLPPDK